MKDYSVKELHNGAINHITSQGGIYLLKMPKGFEIHINDENDGRQLTSKGKPSKYNPEKLKKKADTVYGGDPDKYRSDIIYIGKTDHSVGLQQRLREYLGFRYCEKKSPHDGGRAAWQLQNNENLIIHIETVDVKTDPEVIEKQMLTEFKAKHGDYPLANWKS